MTEATLRLHDKPFFCEGSEAMLALEAMVDRVGTRNVAHALSHICFAKAEHLEHTWQDHELAKAWRKCARVFDRATRAMR
jgi:hypothetical protein